jgi:methionine synthase II (cobalamin-independent)
MPGWPSPTVSTTEVPTTGSAASTAFPVEALGCGTAVGSMPGTDPRESSAVVAGELLELPVLPELPARGPGADLVGRSCALLPDLPVDLQPSGWRLTSRPGVDARRASSYLSHDLDAFSEALDGRAAPVKVSIAGPWTLAAMLQLPRGEPVLSDRGALRDLQQALAEGVAAHLDDVRRRLPGCAVVLQLDEPLLPVVLAGHVPSFSGAGAVEAVPVNDAVAALGALVRAAAPSGTSVVAHCCAAEPPVDVFRESGVAGVSLDLTLVGRDYDDALGEALEGGLVLLAGVAPSVDAPLSEPAVTVAPVRQLWHRLGLDAERLAGQVVVTPTCGLAGASPDHARKVLRLVREAARQLGERED